MGIYQRQIWQCKSCGFEFIGRAGSYEADPNDFGTTHFVSPHYCSKCRNVENISFCISPYRPKPENEHLCRFDNTKCKNCHIEMNILAKTRFKFFKRYYKCPNCGKRTFRFVKEDECWT